MANTTSSKPLLKNAEETAGNLIRKPKQARLRPVRTGLLPPSPQSTEGEVVGMGPLAPIAPMLIGPQAGVTPEAAPTGTTPMQTPEEAGAAAAGLPPLDPKILKAAEDTPEMAAFKAALDAPAPVFTKVGFTMAERVALGFLAGLKGIDAVAPIIEQRRREASDIYQKAVEARGERLSGLFKLGQLSMQARETARTNAEQERAAQFERERFGEQKRQFGVTSAEKQREFDLRQKELAEAQAQREEMRRMPTTTAIGNYNDANSALGSITRIRALVNAGRGGPAQMTGAALGNFIPGISNMAFVQENRELVAELANLNSIFGPARLGANIPAGEREIIEGVLRNPQSTQGDVLRAVAVVERHLSGWREQLIRRYDFGPVSAPTDSSGLTPTMRQEIEELTKDGFSYRYDSAQGHRVYQRGEEYVEVIPDAR